MTEDDGVSEDVQASLIGDGAARGAVVDAACLGLAGTVGCSPLLGGEAVAANVDSSTATEATGRACTREGTRQQTPSEPWQGDDALRDADAAGERPSRAAGEAETVTVALALVAQALSPASRQDGDALQVAAAEMMEEAIQDVDCGSDGNVNPTPEEDREVVVDSSTEVHIGSQGDAAMLPTPIQQDESSEAAVAGKFSDSMSSMRGGNAESCQEKPDYDAAMAEAAVVAAVWAYLEGTTASSWCGEGIFCEPSAGASYSCSAPPLDPSLSVSLAGQAAVVSDANPGGRGSEPNSPAASAAPAARLHAPRTTSANAGSLLAIECISAAAAAAEPAAVEPAGEVLLADAAMGGDQSSFPPPSPSLPPPPSPLSPLGLSALSAIVHQPHTASAATATDIATTATATSPTTTTSTLMACTGGGTNVAARSSSQVLKLLSGECGSLDTWTSSPAPRAAIDEPQQAESAPVSTAGAGADACVEALRGACASPPRRLQSQRDQSITGHLVATNSRGVKREGGGGSNSTALGLDGPDQKRSKLSLCFRRSAPPVASGARRGFPLGDVNQVIAECFKQNKPLHALKVECQPHFSP